MNLLDRLRGRGDGALSCRQVARVLQSFLDGEVDEITADEVQAHLELCRRCGMESDVYAEIKGSLARAGARVPDTTLYRLRRFGEDLARGTRDPDQGA